MIVAGHAVNGDFYRPQYQPPQPFDGSNDGTRNVLNPLMYPWRHSLVIHALYEWTLSINLTAALFFWGVEVLFWSQRDPKSFRAITLGDAAFKYLTHTLPLILIIFEWWHNSIKVAFHRVTAYSVFMTVYFAILCFVSIVKPDSKPYFAIDF